MVLWNWTWATTWATIVWSWNAFDDVYVYIRDWARTLTLTDFYWFVASLSILGAWFISVATLLWALEYWELISLDWWRSFMVFLKN